MDEAVIIFGCHIPALTTIVHSFGYKVILLVDEETIISDDIYYDILLKCKDMFDFDEIVGLIERALIQHKIKAIINQDDALSFIYALVLEKFGMHLNITDGIYNSRLKIIARMLLDRANISNCKYFLLKDFNSLEIAAKHVGFPAVLKPISGFASNYVYKINNLEELQDKSKYILKCLSSIKPKCAHTTTVQRNGIVYNRFSHLLLEEYIEGSEFTVDGFACGNIVQVVAIHQKIGSTEEDGFRDEFYLTPPNNISDETVADVKKFITKVVNTIHFNRSVFHIEIRIAKKGVIKLIEINPRMGGGTVRDNIINSTGIDLLQQQVNMMLGKNIERLPTKNKGIAFGCAVVAKKSGLVKKIHGLEYLRNLPEIKQIRILQPHGSVIPKVVGEIYPVIVSCLCKKYDDIAKVKKIIFDNVNVEMEE